MVHGNYYGVQYEIYLNKELDLYNDILPICIDVRKMISLEKINKDSNQYKLVIIPYREFDKRFEKREHVRKYMSSLDEISYNHQINRNSNPEAFKYYDVKIYKNLIKHNKNLPKPISAEELKSLEESYETIKRICISDDFWTKYSEKERIEFENERISLNDKLNIQRIISKPEYFEEILRIEKSLTNIELTDGEKELIEKVLSHPKLEGAIQCNGIHLIEGFY